MEGCIKFRLEGLNCPNCAAKIEADAKKLDGVSKASVNLMKQEITLDVADGSEAVLHKKVEGIVNKYEPSVKVKDYLDGQRHEHDHSHGHSHEHGAEEGGFQKRLITYGIGLAIFVGALLTKSTYGMVSVALFLLAYLIFGLPVLKTAVVNISKGNIFDENFLMAVSTIGALALGELPEAVFVMFFYQIGEFFQDLAVDRSRSSIKELMNIRPDFARMGNGKSVNPEEVQIGDMIEVRAGEKVPLDGIVEEGSAWLDTSALTGESQPRAVEIGHEVLSGTINTDGLLKIRVTKSFRQSTAMKILELVENAAAKKSETERFITKFARIYTPAVVIAAVLLAFLPPLFTPEADLTMWISRALIFLVISCPCALVLSVPLGFFSGLGEASKRGVLVKGSGYLQALTETETVVFDKTGTLTKGVFEVDSIEAKNGFQKEELLELAAVAESTSGHPIAKAILQYYEKNGKNIENIAIKGFQERSGKGVAAQIKGRHVFAGNARLMEEEGIQIEEYTGIGSVVYLAVDGKYAGRITVSDKIKEDAKQAIHRLKEIGVKNIVMLTGDGKQNAEKTAAALGVDTCYSQLLPGQKVEKLEELMTSKTRGKVLFVGDGINDAPVLARADVGIAMGGVGSDAAIEAADVVIMNDELSKIEDGIIISRKTNRIVKQNIVFALSVKAIVLVMGTVGLASMWLAVFADVGVSFLAILNSMRKKI